MFITCCLLLECGVNCTLSNYRRDRNRYAHPQHKKKNKQTIKSSLADAQESPIGRYRLLSETDIDAVYSHEPHNSLIQA